MADRLKEKEQTVDTLKANLEEAQSQLRESENKRNEDVETLSKQVADHTNEAKQKQQIIDELQAQHAINKNLAEKDSAAQAEVIKDLSRRIE